MLKQKRRTQSKKTVSRGKAGQPAPYGNKTKRIKIQTKEAYDVVMKEIDALMKKGEDKLSKSELNRLSLLAEAAELYEDQNDPLPLPASLPDIIKMRMLQLKLNQHFTAHLLGVSAAKFSMIMNGKQKPDVNFLKALHEKLNVDAETIFKALT